jgi:predicted transporter
MTEILEIYSHISAVIVTIELIVMGIVVRKAWKYTEEEK